MTRHLAKLWVSLLLFSACGAGDPSTTSSTAVFEPSSSPVAATARPADADAALRPGRWEPVALSTQRHASTVVTTCADDAIVVFTGDGDPNVVHDPLTRNGDANVVIDPLTGEVRSIEAAPIDVTRFDAAKIWTGHELIVWGSINNEAGNVQTAGAALDLTTGTWRPIADDNRFADGDAVWAGSTMVVIAAERTSDEVGAAAYSPTEDRWTDLPGPGTTDAPRPYKPDDMVWTGSSVLVPDTTGFQPSRRLDLATSVWSDMATTPLTDHTDPGFAWTGTRLVAQGGYIMRGDTGEAAEGAALYDPATDKWTTIDDPIGTDGGLIGAADAWVIAQRGDSLIAWDPRSGDARKLAVPPWMPMWCAGSEYSVGLARSDSTADGVLSLLRWTPGSTDTDTPPPVTYMPSPTTSIDPRSATQSGQSGPTVDGVPVAPTSGP